MCNLGTLVWPTAARWQIFIVTLFLAAAIAVTAWQTSGALHRAMGAMSVMFVLLWWLSTLVRVLHERAELHSTYVHLHMVDTMLRKTEQRIGYGLISDVLVNHGFEGELDLTVCLMDGTKVSVFGLSNLKGLRKELLLRMQAHCQAQQRECELTKKVQA